METELKFQVPPAQRAAVARAMATSTAQTVRLQAVYFDTADLRLARAGLALRLRRQGRVWVQTLKGHGDGVLHRLEHEVPVGTAAREPAVDPARHAGSEAGERLAAALAHEPRREAAVADGNAHAEPASQGLQPLYRTDITRQLRRVREGGATVEIAYDRGRILAGGHGLAVDEIEFEHVGGRPGSVPALAALAARWVARFDLWWDVRTKSAQGLRLHAAATGAVLPDFDAGAHAARGGARRRVRPRDGLQPRHLWADATLVALSQALACSAAIASSDDGTAATPSGPEADDDDALHRLRLALRRLRAMLGPMAAWSGDADAARQLGREWRAPFAVLGAARDVDVVAASLRRLLDQPGAPAFALPRRSPSADPAACVRGVEFNLLLLRTLGLALSAQAATAAEDPGAKHAAASPAAQTTGAPAASLDDAARGLLRPVWREVLAGAAGYADAPSDTRHRLRKQLKGCAHMLRTLAPLYPARPMRRLQRAVDRALRAMGALGDLDAAAAACRRLAEDDPRAWFAVGWLGARRDAVLGDAVRALQRLDRAPRIWRRR